MLSKIDAVQNFILVPLFIKSFLFFYCAVFYIALNIRIVYLHFQHFFFSPDAAPDNKSN